MKGILASVDQRTQLVGENRLELLLFTLGTRHVFAINVFKVKEVITVPSLHQLPGSHTHLKGVMKYRGAAIPVIDLRGAIKMSSSRDYQTNNVIVTEYNRTVQGFLIGQVLSIVNTSWQKIQPPPSAVGKHNYLTAITQLKIEGKPHLVEIIDVEKVLAEIVSYDTKISDKLLNDELVSKLKGRSVLVVDDSATARWQIRQTLVQLGIIVIEQKNGKAALDLLKSWADGEEKVTDKILMMFTDAEMPEMDGYRLTAEVRQDVRMKDLFIALNTSLSGSFNQAMVDKVGCNRLISKFQPDVLVEVLIQRMTEVINQR